jgi:hypothetical protein
MELIQACGANATTPCAAPGSDASMFEPAPSSIRQVFNISNPAIHLAWFHSYHMKFLTLLKSNTFIIDNLQPGRKCIPVLDLNKLKNCSDGTLDKLKTRIMVPRGGATKQRLD